MRKLLIFLLLFAAGLGTLLVIQRAITPEPSSLEPLVVEPEELVEEQALVVETGESVDQLFTSGALRHTERGVYSVEAADHGPLGGGEYEMKDVLVTFLDADTEAVTGQVRAATARVRMQSDEGRVRFDGAYANALEEVELRFFEGPPPAPVTMRVATATAELDRKRFTSTAPVHITGVGLVATGVGLAAEGLSGSFGIEANPKVQLELEDGTEAVVSSSGPLELERRPDLGEQAVELSVERDAVFVFSGADRLRVEADAIRVFGQLVDEGEGDGHFVPSRVEASGNVVLIPERGRFSADLGLLTFDEAGQPLEAVLEEDPSLAVELEDPDRPDGEPLPLEASGAGPLRVAFGESQAFEFDGPVSLRLPTLPLALDAEGGIAGELGPGTGFGTIATHGGVTARHHAYSLTTEGFEVDAFEDGDGETGLRMRAPRPARSEGVLNDGRPYTLIAREGFVVLHSQDAQRLPEARGVELVVGDPDGFTARADRVRDFDPEALSFLALGNVVLENARGVGTGDRLESFGHERAELSGSEDTPANLKFEGGELEAGWVEFSPTAVHARDTVDARFEFEGEDYELRSDWVSLDYAEGPEDQAEAPEFTLDAGGNVSAIVENEDQRYEMSSDFFRLQAERTDEDRAAAVPAGEVPDIESLEPAYVLASGNAHFDVTGTFEIEGWGDRLEIQRDRTGRLYPVEGGRTRVAGVLPQENIEFEMTAGIVDFSADRLVAIDPDMTAIEVLPDAAPTTESLLGGGQVRAIAGRMAADRGSILFSEGAYVGQQAPGQPDWSMDAQNILINGSSEDDAEAVPQDVLSNVLAWGGFNAQLGETMSAQGKHLQIDRKSGLLRMVGEPVVLDREGLTWRSDWFQMNLRTAFMKSGPGVLGAAPSKSEPWTLEYESLEPVENPDETIQVMREPRVTSGDQELRASWALLWVDTREWAEQSGVAFRETVSTLPEAPGPGGLGSPGTRKPPHPDSLFGILAASEIGDSLREIYIEGNIEILEKGVRKARADAVYLDLIGGQAWVEKFDIAVDLPFIRDDFRLKLQADLLRHSADGSFRADSAVATTCHFEDPHFVVRIGNFEVEPRYRDRPRRRNEPGEGDTVREPDGWDVRAEESAMSLGDYISIPLPKMRVPVETTSSGGFKIDTDRLSLGGLQPISFGSDSKLGSFISTTFTTDLGFASKGLHRLLGGNSDLSDLDGKTSVRPSYNNDRGVGLGIETEMGSEDRYELLMAVDLIDDSGEDRGLVRVDEADRDSLRTWFRARGRYLLGDKEWVDLVVTHQTDPGVQSEFFESEFLRYEERESYLHWRRAEDPNYFSVTVEQNLDDYRSEVQDQPTINHARSRTELARWRDTSLVYSSATELGRLDRVEGDVPTEPPFLDGYGEQDTLRFDTRQRLEASIPLGALGLRAIPYLEARATAWEIDSAMGTGPVASAEDPTRLALLGGAVVSTSFWRSYAGGVRHVLAPFVGIRGDLALDEDGAPLVQFDATENTLEGKFVDVGVRSHLVNPVRRSFFDIELIETHASDVGGTSVGDGWQPLRVHGSWFIPVAGMPFGIAHDARYDLENGETPYSRTRVGLEPIDRLTLEAGYHSARDLAGQSIYNVLTTAAVFKVSPKWELEGGYGFSTQGDGRLSSDVEVRRIGHDFVFSVSYKFLAGEGGSSLNYSIAPLLGWKPANPSFLRRLHDVRD